MNKTNDCAIIILYKGVVADAQVVQDLRDALVGNGATIPELLSITVKDRDGIQDSLLREAVEIKDVPVSAEEKIDNAVTYIGERYKEYMNTPHLTMFAIRLAQDVSTARVVDTRDNRALLNAIEIISTESGYVKKEHMRLYGFTEAVINIIKRVHNPY